MTIREFVKQLWENDPNGNCEEMDIQTAYEDIENFKADGWDLPEDIAPESYMEAWNELVEENKPKTYGEYFADHPDENLSWCKPYFYERDNCYVIMNGNEVTDIIKDGVRKEPTPDMIRDLATSYNPDYADYSGWDDVYMLLDVMVELGCASCPMFKECQAMKEEII